MLNQLITMLIPEIIPATTNQEAVQFGFSSTSLQKSKCQRINAPTQEHHWLWKKLVAELNIFAYLQDPDMVLRMTSGSLQIGAR